MLKKILSLIIASTVFAPTPSYSADEKAINQLLTLNIEELSQVGVSTASKKQERLIDAPGIISIITADDIKNYGASNLLDILRRLTNVQIFNSPVFHTVGTSMRAGASQHLDSRILHLINGRPIRESHAGGLFMDLHLFFPVETIERIEVIRGPGSVLYGSNAFSGVINIITKKPSKAKEATLSATYGTHNWRRALAETSHKFDQGYLQFSAVGHDTDGWSLNARDEAATLGNAKMAHNGSNFVLTGEYKGFSVNAIHSRSFLPTFFGTFTFPVNEQRFERKFIDLGYQYQFDNNWKASLNGTYNGYFINSPVGSAAFDRQRSDGFLIETTVEKQLTDKFHLLMGGVFEQMQGDLDNDGDYALWRQNLYAQGDFWINDKVKLVAGAQWNKPQNVKYNLSPRLGLIYNHNKNWSYKALYGEAFRVPSGAESFFDLPFLKGDASLKPEKIKTKDFQINYTTSNFNIATTYYHSVVEDAIGRELLGVNTFVNKDGTIDYKGIELEGKWKVDARWKVEGNLSYQKSEDSLGQSDVAPASNFIFKLGANYTDPKGFNIGVFNSHFGDVAKLENLIGNSIVVVNPTADEYNFLSANIDINVNDFFKLNTKPQMNFSIFANNLLDEDVYFPDLNRSVVNTFPQTAGRTFYATFTTRF